MLFKLPPLELALALPLRAFSSIAVWTSALRENGEMKSASDPLAFLVGAYRRTQGKKLSRMR